ncbi:MAG: glucose-6-phosphate isomerase family protein [Methanomicrobiales archaeon]
MLPEPRKTGSGSPPRGFGLISRLFHRANFGEITIKQKGIITPAGPSGTGYPEIYKVLAGEAHYLIQNEDCSEIIMIAASARDVVVIPLEYGHVTINPTRSTLLHMANFVSSQGSSNYLGYEAKNDAAFFEWVREGFVKNPVYKSHTSLGLVKVRRLAEVKDAISDPHYDLVEDRAPVLEFLNHPDKFEPLFRELDP